jgi:protein O-GlcNAc transferase
MMMPLPSGHDESVVAEAARHAVTFHQRGMLAEAEKIYTAILEARPDHFDALRLLGILRQQQGDNSEAARLIAAALKMNPRSVEALCNFGDVLNALDRHDEALAAYDRALAIQGDHVEILCRRGSALIALRRFEEALAAFDRALVLTPDLPVALTYRGNVLVHLDRLEEALAAFDRVLAVKVDQIEALISRGNTLMLLGHVEEALATFDKVIAIRPDHAVVHGNRALALSELGRHEDALGSFGKALELAPNNVTWLDGHGNTLMSLGRDADALAAFEQALALAPGRPEIHKRRAEVLRNLRRHHDAVAAYDIVLATDPNDSDAHYDRGISLWMLGQREAALASYERAFSLNDTRAVSKLALGRLIVADWRGADDLTGALRARIADGSIVDPLTTLAFGFEPALRLRAARTCVEFFAPAPRMPFVHLNAGKAEKLRIAYLSSDFRQHPVGLAIVELIERHDRARFEIIGVSSGADDATSTRARFVKAFDHFHDVASDADRDVARLLNGHEVHIAIDLNGLTEGMRPGVLSYRPAPIQVSYLGFAGTSGADFIDYILADETALPFDQQPFFAEKIVQLPGCYHANDTTRQISPQTPARSELGLPDRGFVFCCFNQGYKIAAPVFDVWMRLLARVPGSVLWLSDMNDIARANLQRVAAGHGIAPDRIVFAPYAICVEDHLARQRAADLFLDTLPYNAHSTACDALFTGLPVLTCAGTTFPGRVAASMVVSAGLPELVTHSLDDYEALALRLATNPELLQSTRRKLADSRSICALFDGDRLRRNIEAAYATMWDIYRKGESPRSFRVEPSA